MGPRRRLIGGLAIAGVVAAGWLAAPRRFVVDGVSMGPALLPGDVVRTAAFPVLDRLRRPARFERWTLRAMDGLAIKRIVGLPGEEISIAGGDLVIDGTVVPKGPRLLAELGSVVVDAADVPSPCSAEDWAWSRPAGEILDDAVFDAGTSRLLEAVTDAGLAAVVDVADAAATKPATIRVAVGDTIVSRPLAEPGRHAVVAGRLDGRLVVAAWRVRRDTVPNAGRSCLPDAAPETWQVVEPWPAITGDAAPTLAIGAGSDGRATVAAVSRWRDVAYRPAADGRTAWRLGDDEVFVLGDHPAASTDSRRWGPVAVSALRCRIPRSR